VQSSLHDMVRRIKGYPASTGNDLRQHVDLLLPLIRATCGLQKEWRDISLPVRRSANG
jgi:hypothetical protein